MKKLLAKKVFGMPAPVFAGLLLAAILVGLYLRSRSRAAADATTAEGANTDGTQPLDTSQDGGLAGFAGPAAGSVVPIQTPTIPEGFGDVVGSLTGTITELAAGYNPPSSGADAVNPSPAGAITSPSTGGGPPSRRHVSHGAPISRAAYRRKAAAIRKNVKSPRKEKAALHKLKIRYRGRVRG